MSRGGSSTAAGGVGTNTHAAARPHRRTGSNTSSEMYYAAAVKDPTVVAHLSKQQPQQRNNKSTSTTTIHPYSSVSLSPCRNYAIAACKSDVQIVKVDPTGLHHLRTVSCNPYFVMAAAHKKKQHNHQDGGANGYEESLNLREFAFGGMGGGPNNPPPPASSSSASVSASMMNVVITDVAWSPWSTISVVEDMPGSSADGTLGDTTHHHSFPSTTNIHQNNPTTNNKDNNNSQNHHGLIAAAGSNGTIVVWNASALLNIPQSSFSGQQQQQQHNPIQHAPEAVLSLHVRAVNRLAWHPQRAMLLSASQDGTVLLWERKLQPIRTKDSVSKSREKKEASLGKFRGLFGPMGSSAPLQPQQSYDWFCRATFAPKSEAVRDICWSPFYEDVFALVTTSGFLIIYNRNVCARALVKMSAHSGDATTLDFHPTKPNIIATGSSDRSVKVWDLESDLIFGQKDDGFVAVNYNTATSKTESASICTNDSSTGNDSYNPVVMSRALSSTSSAFLNASRHKASQKNMLHMLSISASVTRLRWRPPSHDKDRTGDDRHDSMIAVSTAPIKGASAGGSGMMSLWSYHRPFMPLSIVEGHKEGAVADFEWLDTPKIDCQRTGESILSSKFHTLEEAKLGYVMKTRDFELGADNGMNLWQHVLSVGRDGLCLVSSFARGYRPISRVPKSTFVLANLSPFQRGYGSLEVFSVCQNVPSEPKNDFGLTGLRTEVEAPGIFRETLQDNNGQGVSSANVNKNFSVTRRLPSKAPEIVFNIVDQGDLDDRLNPVDKKSDVMMISPEVVHLSRFAERYKLRTDAMFPSKVSLCIHNSKVAESLKCPALANMWEMVAAMLDDIENDFDGGCQYPVNVMQFVRFPTIRALFEERADAGDVQTCVALCEILEVVSADQTVAIPGLDRNCVREWYLVYIDMLRDFCLFSIATDLIRHCKDPFISALNQQGTTFHECCQHCGKALDPSQETSPVRRFCKSCTRRVGLCFVCHEPVKGVYVWCPGCGHGGHLDHALEWFGDVAGKKVRETCPTGCGHKCNLMKSLSAFPSTLSMHELAGQNQSDSFYENSVIANPGKTAP